MKTKQMFEDLMCVSMYSLTSMSIAAAVNTAAIATAATY
jgi:hypothetical protein